MPETLKFDFKNHPCELICPDRAAKYNPWVWRTEFLYAFNQADEALLNMGYHIAYCSYSNEYGSPGSIELFKEFHDYLISEYNLNSKASLFGFSRGGLYAVNYSLKYPDDVSSVYLDAPVVNIGSWPGGFYKGLGGPNEWQDLKTRVLKVSTDEEALSSSLNPVNNLEDYALLNIPTLIIVGDSDRYVPYEENGLLIKNAFEKAGRDITVIIKQGCDHHPHSLDDVTPITDFVINSYNL